MAYLKMLEIGAEEKKRQSKTGVPLRATVYHIKEIFLYFLPKKFYLDGSGKVQITLCAGDADQSCWTVLGVTELKVSYFDFDRYFLLSKREQEHRILSLIRETLAAHCGESAPANHDIALACRQTEESDFHLRYEIEKLRKTERARKYRIMVFRELNRDVGERWEVVGERNGTVLWRVYLRDSTYVHIDACCRKSRIEEDKFIVTDEVDRVHFALNLKELCG